MGTAEPRAHSVSSRAEQVLARVAEQFGLPLSEIDPSARPSPTPVSKSGPGFSAAAGSTGIGARSSGAVAPSARSHPSGHTGLLIERSTPGPGQHQRLLEGDGRPSGATGTGTGQTCLVGPQRGVSNLGACQSRSVRFPWMQPGADKSSSGDGGGSAGAGDRKAKPKQAQRGQPGQLQWREWEDDPEHGERSGGSDLDDPLGLDGREKDPHGLEDSSGADDPDERTGQEGGDPRHRRLLLAEADSTGTEGTSSSSDTGEDWDKYSSRSSGSSRASGSVERSRRRRNKETPARRWASHRARAARSQGAAAARPSPVPPVSLLPRGARFDTPEWEALAAVLQALPQLPRWARQGVRRLVVQLRGGNKGDSERRGTRSSKQQQFG